MNYDIYKNARNASWNFLIDHNVRCLPLDLKSIVSNMGVLVKLDNYNILQENERGKTVSLNGQLAIIVSNATAQQTRYTISHEIGHIVLGHFGAKEISANMEYAAERFAIGILSPACVLWGLDIRTAEEIADLCNISITSAKIREKRMQELYDRNKFLSSPLERKVFEQFSDFINSKKQS